MTQPASKPAPQPESATATAPLSAPVRIRPTDGPLIGTTAFFRNRAFLAAFCRQIRAKPGKPVRIMAHACSVGAEAYSLAVRLLIDRPELDFQIDATDLSQGFVNYAERGFYPNAALAGATEGELKHFLPAGGDAVGVSPDVRARVRFLPAASFADFTANAEYDVVLLCNALVYVDGAAQGATIDRIAGYNTDLLAVTAAHQDRIAEDLARNDYAPVMDDFAAIHAGWTDRHRPAGFPKGSPPPTGAFADPYLDPIDNDTGWQYRHGAFFRKLTGIFVQSS